MNQLCYFSQHFYVTNGLQFFFSRFFKRKFLIAFFKFSLMIQHFLYIVIKIEKILNKIKFKILNDQQRVLNFYQIILKK